MVFHTWHVSFKTDSIILQTDRQIQPKIIGFLLRKEQQEVITTSCCSFV
ncbi:hypothetical protein D354_01406 [Enterococcus faecalis]|nr:hypothetical protein D354_01406 [Enterococcus faecalis]EPI26923.1 hypothetical protein D351_02268 [Enterococcus faecalis WKS-26-18-2]